MARGLELHAPFPERQSEKVNHYSPTPVLKVKFQNVQNPRLLLGIYTARWFVGSAWMASHEEPADLVQRLTDEIVSLNDLQIEAMKRATFLGMTDEEREEYDRRFDRIAELLQELTTITSRRAA